MSIPSPSSCNASPKHFTDSLSELEFYSSLLEKKESQTNESQSLSLCDSTASSDQLSNSCNDDIAKQVCRSSSAVSAEIIINRNWNFLSSHPELLICCLHHIVERIAPKDIKRKNSRKVETHTCNHSEGWSIVTQIQKHVSSSIRSGSAVLAGSDLCVFLQCLAKCYVRDMPVYRLVTKEMQKRTPPYSFTVSELQQMLWALLKGLEYNCDDKGGIAITSYDTEFVEFVIESFKTQKNKIGRLTPQQICGVLRSVARLGHKDAELLQIIGIEALKRQKQFADRDWATIVKAFTQFDVALRGECTSLKRPSNRRDWERPPPPKMPKPMSEC